MTEHKLPFSSANLPLSSRSGSSFDNDGGARWCDRTRNCNLSPSRRLYSRKQLLLYATKREDKTSEAVKNAQMALSHQECSASISTNRCIF